MYGWTGKILSVNLSNRDILILKPSLDFYRTFMGGRALIAYYLLTETKPGIEPLSSENILIFTGGPVTGVPVSGSGRHAVGAKSPLTEGIASAEAGGFWGAELKHAGYDAIIVKGVSPNPVYLWINGDEVQIRDAGTIWGMETLEAFLWIKENLKDGHARIALIGPAGEKLVRFANIAFDLRNFAGRGGLGAVMGSKKIKAIAVRASKATNYKNIAEPDKVKHLSKWMVDNFDLMKGLYTTGTSGNLSSVNYLGGLPTENFNYGQFTGAEKISGEQMLDHLLVGRETCYACVVRCKRKVAEDDPYKISCMYGGPEYEAIAGFGSNLGIDDLDALAFANMRCAALGLDTISTSGAIAFAFECFKNGVLTINDTGGKTISFGDTPSMLWLIESIGSRNGLGDILSEGVRRASESIGNGAEKFALYVKSQELPLHEARFKHGMGLGYAVSPTGADHEHNMHDDDFTQESGSLRRIRSFNDFKPMKVDDLSFQKIELFTCHTNWQHLMDCLVMCRFLPYNVEQITDLVNSVTGCDYDKWELLKVGERAATLARLYNIREGIGKNQDKLPDRFFSPLLNGPLAGVTLNPIAFENAVNYYYQMMGWDIEGRPTKERLKSLSLDMIELNRI